MARILAIDDENNIRMMIQLALEQSGHEVETAADGITALEKFGDGSEYDLVLLDQRMPGMEGLEVLQEMKSRNPDARIIMITAYATIDLAVDAMKAGATDFLRKPFTTETLRGAVLGAMMTEPRPQQQAVSTEPAEVAAEEEFLESSPILYGFSTINGFHIESDPTNVVIEAGDRRYSFSIREPSGRTQDCTVIFTSALISEVKSFIRSESMPGGDRFWHALAEYALSNYVYHHADFPRNQCLTIGEFDRGMQNWVKSVAVIA